MRSTSIGLAKDREADRGSLASPRKPSSASGADPENYLAGAPRDEKSLAQYSETLWTGCESTPTCSEATTRNFSAAKMTESAVTRLDELPEPTGFVRVPPCAIRLAGTCGETCSVSHMTLMTMMGSDNCGILAHELHASGTIGTVEAAANDFRPRGAVQFDQMSSCGMIGSYAASQCSSAAMGIAPGGYGFRTTALIGSKVPLEIDLEICVADRPLLGGCVLLVLPPAASFHAGQFEMLLSPSELEVRLTYAYCINNNDISMKPPMLVLCEVPQH